MLSGLVGSSRLMQSEHAKRANIDFKKLTSAVTFISGLLVDQFELLDGRVHSNTINL